MYPDEKSGRYYETDTAQVYFSLYGALKAVAGKNLCLMFCTLIEQRKKQQFCSPQRQCRRLQNRACPLFSAFYSFLYGFYWCSSDLSASLRSGSPPGICTKQKMKLSHMGNDVSCHWKKKKKKRSTSAVSYFFSSFILTDDLLL